MRTIAVATAKSRLSAVLAEVEAGEGSTFRVVLPLKQPEEKAE